MRPEERGQGLITKLKAHLLKVLAELNACAPGGPGLGNVNPSGR